MIHLKIWSVLFFVFGYLTTGVLFFEDEFYLKMVGLTFNAYLNYILIEQIIEN
jgi:hypothetical protein